MNEVLRLLVGPTQSTEFEDGPIVETILRLETVKAPDVRQNLTFLPFLVLFFLSR